ncbi:TcpE family conjugal transfer membrane protein [Senimuribacter intestinalis]|uniref:TcpE family conjugal transfer membrane protein n=1 Tax=Senimuribacter intestinalis TaxID=2941507 RepID=UPI00203BBAD5|nr:TcpE family conjugal transfer membrane protein [Senimuribacter intestinalis]
MAKDEDRVIVLRSYATVWQYEKKLYSIDSLKLWIPVAANDLLFFVVGLVLVVILSKISVFAAIPWVIRYGAIPFLIMKFFTKMKFDGKSPHKFALGYVEYRLLPEYLSKFQECNDYTEGCFQNVLYRGTEIINIIDARLQSSKGKTGKKKRRGEK